MSFSLQDFLNGLSHIPFPYFYFHDVGHHIKNARAALERGTLFDSRYNFDATDILLALITSKNESYEKISSGLGHTALEQLDKHRDEHALQRICKNVIDGLSDAESILKTDVPEVFRPWFAPNHNKIGFILFVTVSSAGVVFCMDSFYKQQLFYYGQTPIPRKLVYLAAGKTEEVEDNTPCAPETMSSKKIKWNSISGLTIVSYNENRKEALLVACAYLKVFIFCEEHQKKTFLCAKSY